MNFAIVSLNDRNYEILANVTWEKNKVPYAEKHGYFYARKNNNFYGVCIGFEKIRFILDMLETYPEIDWLWWVGCDTLITNMNTKLEEKIDDNFHFIIATDCNGINADSFFVRNSVEGRNYISYLNSQYEKYKNHVWVEQQAIIDSVEEFKNIIKFVPQREINAYNYALYPECDPHDKFGNNGMWQPGDLLIHWPGTSLQHRLHLASQYLQQVIN